MISTKESSEVKTCVKSDQVQKSPEHNVESQSAQVVEGETRGISYEGDDRNASTFNDDNSTREPTTPSTAIAPQPGTSPIGTSVGGDEDDEQMSSVSSERFSEWRQFWTLLSPIPDGFEDFRWGPFSKHKSLNIVRCDQSRSSSFGFQNIDSAL